MKFVIATHNQHKLQELQRILAPLGIEAITADLSEVEETGTTFAENAFLKAQSACRETGLPAVADDSRLGGRGPGRPPGGVFRPVCGENATDAQRIEKLLGELEGVPAEKRGARFVSAVCCVFPDGERIQVEGECPGAIAFAPAGEDGFGYDPVFLCGEKTFAQMTAAEKDAVSHRGKALEKFSQALEAFLKK